MEVSRTTSPRTPALPLSLPLLAVLALTTVGVAFRVVAARDALFADELSTYWIVTTHGLGGVISTVHSNAEITPPLYFVASWLTTQAGHAPELVRAPSLIAGALTIPAVHALGVRTVGRTAALVATALTALSPFMIYYSAEARAYGVMMLFVVLSTLAMLIAADTRRGRWWVAYALCSCAAVYSHYTCVFALGAQLGWLLWAHPETRRAAVVSNLGAVAGFLPWSTGLVADLTSPTSKILSALSPFTAHDVRLGVEHWLIGYPYTWVARLPELPGAVALVLLGLALLVAAAGIATQRPRLDRRLVLVALLFVSAPVGEALVSVVGTNLFGVRNLAASWPAFALLLGAMLAAAGPRLRVAAAVLAVASFALGAAKLLESRYQRPDYRGAADFIARSARPADAVIDETAVLSPGPLSPLDVVLDTRLPVFRAGAPAERDHPFGFADPVVGLSDVVPQATAAAAGGGRIFLVGTAFPERIPGLDQRTTAVRRPFPARYLREEVRRYPGFADITVAVYSDSG